MSIGRSSISKITRPLLPDIYRRTRLFVTLERSSSPVTWITGPPGSGKTTLVASYLDARKRPAVWYQVDEGDADLASFFFYLGLAARKAAPRTRRPLPLLTPEYQFGIPTFTRRFFEDLFSRLKPPFSFVLDNYQDAAENSPVHEAVVNGLSALPRGVRAYILSRSGPPPAFARMQANSGLSEVGWEQLRMTPEETAAVMRLRTGRPQSKDAARVLHEKTQGWAAGIVLMDALQVAGGEGKDPAAMEPGKLSDYFAGEIFGKLNESTRDFLLRTSFFPRFTSAMAEAITGNSRAGQLLAELNRRNYFTERRAEPETSYQYHSLFREFLGNLADTHFTEDERSRLMQSAAKLLEEAGQVEDAASLLMKAGDGSGLARLILGNAQSLVSQGRNKTLAEWITSIPGEILSRNPWLQYWLGACLAPYDSNEAIRYFKKAFALFDGEKHKEGVFLSWAAIVGAIYFSFEDLQRLNGYIGNLDELVKKYGEVPPGEIDAAVTAGMIVAIIMSGEHPAVDQWQEHALSVIDRVPDGNTRLLCMGQYFYYRVLCGDYEGATRMLRQMNEMMKRCECGILMRLKIKIIEAMLCTYSAQYEECLNAVTEGLALAEKSGVHALDMILMGMIAWCSISMNVPDTARKYLVRMEASLGNARAWDLTCYYLFSAFEALERKDLGKASRHAHEAYALSQKVGASTSKYWCSLFLAVTLEESGDRKSARAQFKEACDDAARWNTPFFTFDYLLSETWFLFRQEKETEGLTSLKKVLRIGREHGFHSSFIWRHSILGELFARALSEGIEVEYVRGLIRRHNFRPPFDKGGTAGMLIDAWPWPLRISTLGKFEIRKDDKPLTVSGKVQKKPLQLLKALIALGGTDVREDRLADLLWPDAEGDAGLKAVNVNTVRLRKLLGVSEAIIVQDGTLTLDRRLCWVDVRAFEQILDEGEKGRGGDSPAHGFLEKAISFYRGPFLADEPGLWAVSLREKLRDRFLRSIDALGAHLEHAGQHHEALSVYRRGLEVDDLAEPYYRRIMNCHIALGSHAEALSVYKRCSKTLSAYGVEPSAETEALYKSILKDK